MSDAHPNVDPPLKPAEATAPADSDDNEPQNALTQKFTEKEWAALKEFRVCALADHSLDLCSNNSLLVKSLLPDILGAAYDGKEDARTTPIVIWGVTLDPNGKKDARASVVLMKWLRARCILPVSIPKFSHTLTCL
jgi:phosphatidylinositol transfer protein SFH5